MNLSQIDLISVQKSVENILLNEKKFICDGFSIHSVIENKDVRDISTNIDVNVEASIRKSLHSLLPNASFIVEEGTSTYDFDYIWVIDPIDGTKNYHKQLPMFYSQVALLYKNEPILGVVFNPLSNQLFSASKGNGAYVNSLRIIAQTNHDLNSSIIDLDMLGSDVDLNRKLSLFSKLFASCYRVRMSTGFMRPYIITGAIDASIRVNNHSKKQHTDISAHLILSQEAGLINEFININGMDLIITSNIQLTQKIKSLFL